MNFWIAVTSGMRWDRLLKNRVVLEAPNKARYQNFFADVKPGDFVLYYLTKALTVQKEKQSSVVGVSRTVSEPNVDGKKIMVACSDTLILPRPISFKEILGLKRKSPLLRGLAVGLRMQRYLSKISRSDFESILRVHSTNMQRLSRSRLARQLKLF